MEEAQEQPAFSTSDRFFQYIVMTFGLNKEPVFFFSEIDGPDPVFTLQLFSFLPGQCGHF